MNYINYYKDYLDFDTHFRLNIIYKLDHPFIYKILNYKKYLEYKDNPNFKKTMIKFGLPNYDFILFMRMTLDTFNNYHFNNYKNNVYGFNKNNTLIVLSDLNSIKQYFIYKNGELNKIEYFTLKHYVLYKKIPCTTLYIKDLKLFSMNSITLETYDSNQYKIYYSIFDYYYENYIIICDNHNAEFTIVKNNNDFCDFIENELICYNIKEEYVDFWINKIQEIIIKMNIKTIFYNLEF